MTLFNVRLCSFLSLAAGLLILSGCSNKYVDEIDRGAGYNYQPGLPEVRLAASGQIDESNTPIVIVSGDVVEGSLVYSEKNGVYEANINVEILVRNTENEGESIQRRSFDKKLTDTLGTIINSQDVYRFEEVFEVKPGAYEIQVIVTDQKSGKRVGRALNTELPDPEDQISHVTEIRMLAKNSDSENSTFTQVTTYDVPSRFDSLKFVFQVTNNTPNEPLELTSRLLKFRADTSIARPMHFNNYTPSSIQHIGIDYNEFEVIQKSTRTLDQPGSVLIEFIFPDLPRGNYRVEVSALEGEEDELFKARDFSIKSKYYPSLRTPKELARPLHYLMDEDEYEELMQINDPQQLKGAIDRFWLSNVQNSNVAKNVISQYYQRVEEANKQFSNYKEGWKTDPGMIYILFGPPLYADNYTDQMLWSYSYNRDDPEQNFLFVRSKLKSKYFPFHNYIFQRHSYYHSIHIRQVQRWLSGRILSTNL